MLQSTVRRMSTSDDLGNIITIEHNDINKVILNSMCPKVSDESKQMLLHLQ